MLENIGAICTYFGCGRWIGAQVCHLGAGECQICRHFFPGTDAAVVIRSGSTKHFIRKLSFFTLARSCGPSVESGYRLRDGRRLDFAEGFRSNFAGRSAITFIYGCRLQSSQLQGGAKCIDAAVVVGSGFAQHRVR